MSIVDSENFKQSGVFGWVAGRIRNLVDVDDAESAVNTKSVVKRDELDDLVRLHQDGDFAQASELLKSEKLERESMAMIRDALYKT